MSLSDQTRAKLKRLGYTEWVHVWICSDCGKPPGAMDPNKPHALQPEADKILKRKDITTEQREVLKHNISKIMSNSSRCCGAELSLTFCSYYEVLYESWRNRWNNSVSKQVNQPFKYKGKVLLPSTRQRYGSHEKYHDDDFILMHQLWGLSDVMTGELIKIFREEDALENSPQNSTDKDKPNFSENMDFLEWVQSW